jgi:type IV secretion system protein VirD4
VKRHPPHAIGWPLGKSRQPRGVDLWVPYDRTTGVIGPQGSGKTLDLLVHAELSAPGAMLQTSTKPDDVLLTVPRRSTDDRPIAVCDPFGLLPGLPPLVWDPLSGCVDSMAATKRAKAFAAGTVKGAATASGNDASARFYAAEAAKVLQGYFHAAALTGRTLDHVMEWVADPVGTETAETILSQHPHAEQHWAGLLRGSLRGSADTVANTVATVQQAMSLFMHGEIVRRCVPSSRAPSTDLADLIKRGGTIYLLGKDDPYTSVSPLLTAITDDVLDTAEWLAATSRHGRLAPPFVVALDELPSIAPIPTLPQRMADGRARGLCIVWAAQTWRQLVTCYGEDTARTITGITNVLVVFGGGKDVRFNQEMSELIGTTEVERRTYSHGRGSSSSQTTYQDVPTLRPHEIGRIQPRHAVVLAETSPALIARLRRVVEGKSGAALLAGLEHMRAEVAAHRLHAPSRHDLRSSALAAAHHYGLHVDSTRDPQ